MVARLRR
jgi:hypothetical protein